MIENMLIGYRKFTSKNNVACCIITVISPFGQADIDHGAVGKRANEIFLPSNCHDLIQPDKIGAVCTLTYVQGYDGRPTVSGIEFKK